VARDPSRKWATLKHISFDRPRRFHVSSLDSYDDLKSQTCANRSACLRNRLIRSKLNKLRANCETVHQSARVLLCGYFDVPHPVPDIGNGFHGPHLVKLPSRRVLSDQTGVSKGGDGRYFTSAANHHIARRICKGSRWWLR
jgi:hypothetical protein